MLAMTNRNGHRPAGA